MKDRHKLGISVDTHFRINVIIAFCDQRDGLVLLVGSEAKDLESSV